jgi:DNA-binding LacI/PurR family transcriptional regulator
MKIKKPTIKDVAIVAGVSTQTISRVLNNRVDVAEATRVRILKVISDLDYSPNEAARNLVRQRSRRSPYIPVEDDTTHYASNNPPVDS